MRMKDEDCKYSIQQTVSCIINDLDTFVRNLEHDHNLNKSNKEEAEHFRKKLCAFYDFVTSDQKDFHYRLLDVTNFKPKHK